MAAMAEPSLSDDERIAGALGRIAAAEALRFMRDHHLGIMRASLWRARGGSLAGGGAAGNEASVIGGAGELAAYAVEKGVASDARFLPLAGVAAGMAEEAAGILERDYARLLPADGEDG